MSKPTPTARASAIRTLALACEPRHPRAAAILREAAQHVAEGAAVLTGPLAVRLRDAGLDAVTAAAACRVLR